MVHVPATPLVVQFPADAPGKTGLKKKNTAAWCIATQLGDPDRFPNTWFHLGPAVVIVILWGVIHRGWDAALSCSFFLPFSKETNKLTKHHGRDPCLVSRGLAFYQTYVGLNPASATYQPEGFKEDI